MQEISKTKKPLDSSENGKNNEAKEIKKEKSNEKLLQHRKSDEKLTKMHQYSEGIDKKKMNQHSHFESENSLAITISDSSSEIEQSVDASSSKSKYYSSAHEEYLKNKKEIIDQYPLTRKYVDKGTIGKLKGRMNNAFFNRSRTIEDRQERLDLRKEAHKKLQEQLKIWNDDIDKRSKEAARKSKSLSNGLVKQDIYKHAGVTDIYNLDERDKHIAEMDSDFHEEVADHQAKAEKLGKELIAYMKEQTRCGKLGLKIQEKQQEIVQMRLNSKFVKEGGYPGALHKVISDQLNTSTDTSANVSSLRTDEVSELERDLKNLNSYEEIKKALKREGIDSIEIKDLNKELNIISGKKTSDIVINETKQDLETLKNNPELLEKEFKELEKELEELEQPEKQQQ